MPIDLRFSCSEYKDDYLKVKEFPDGGYVEVYGMCRGKTVSYMFDISTAIKLSKTIRTEINKAKEDQNG